MAGFVRVSGYSQEDIDKKKARKIGSYTGNQSINVSAYKRTGDTVANFLIEVTGTSGQAYAVYGGYLDDIRGGASGITPSKALSGNTLSITASPQAFISHSEGGAIHTDATSTYSLTYNVWYIPS